MLCPDNSINNLFMSSHSLHFFLYSNLFFDNSIKFFFLSNTSWKLFAFLNIFSIESLTKSSTTLDVLCKYCFNVEASESNIFSKASSAKDLYVVTFILKQSIFITFGNFSISLLFCLIKSKLYFQSSMTVKFFSIYGSKSK